MVGSPVCEQENEQNQQSGGGQQNVASNNGLDRLKSGEQGKQAAGEDNSQQQPAAMSSSFYTDELAMQAADNATETIAESAASGTEQENKAPEVKVDPCNHPTNQVWCKDIL